MVILMLLEILGRGLVLCVYLQLFHFLLGFSYFLLYLGFLLKFELLATELLEHILVMQNSVCELILKLIALEELRNTRLDLGHF